MIQITDAEKRKWESGRYLKELKVYFPSINLTLDNDDIYSESMSLKESLFDGNGALEISGCVSSSFSVEIRHQAQELKNQSIIASIRIDNNNWLTLFRGYVDSVETVRDRSYQKIQCYDALSQYANKNVFLAYNNLNDTFTVKQLRNALFNAVGITQKVQSLPNDSVTLVKTIDSGEIAFIDAVKAVCQINGMFGVINRSGVFEYRQMSTWEDYLPYPSNDLFPSDDVYPGVLNSMSHEYIDAYQSIKYEDYKVASIDKVVIRDTSSDESEGSYGTGNNALYITGNIFLEGLTGITKDTIAENLFNVVWYNEYRPFDAVNLGRPYLEVGDAVTYYVYDYSSGSPVVNIMSYTILTRTLKGIQWLRDEYSAAGEQYQPEIKLESSGSQSSAINSMKDDIKSIQNAVNDLASGKQDFIDLDILEPTWNASEGHITLNKTQTTSGYVYQWYRREGNQWQKMHVAQFSTQDIEPGVTPLPTGEIYLVYE